jgi:hypothetical protein
MKFRKGHEWPVLFATILLVVPTSLFRAWLLTFMWAWFILPLGLAVPTVWVLAGLLMTVSFVRGVPVDNDPKEYEWSEVVGKMVTSGFVTPSIGIAFAWLIALLGGLL